MIVHHAEVICHEVTSYNNSCQNHEGQCLKKVKKAISWFPDRDLKFPELGNFSSGPDKSGIRKPELAIPIAWERIEYIWQNHQIEFCPIWVHEWFQEPDFNWFTKYLVYWAFAIFCVVPKSKGHIKLGYWNIYVYLEWEESIISAKCPYTTF